MSRSSQQLCGSFAIDNLLFVSIRRLSIFTHCTVRQLPVSLLPFSIQQSSLNTVSIAPSRPPIALRIVSLARLIIIADSRRLSLLLQCVGYRRRARGRWASNQSGFCRGSKRGINSRRSLTFASYNSVVNVSTVAARHWFLPVWPHSVAHRTPALCVRVYIQATSALAIRFLFELIGSRTTPQSNARNEIYRQ